MLKKYFEDLTSDLDRESERIKHFYASHKPSAGANREILVAKLLSNHLLPSVGIETGLIMSTQGEFSGQSDIVLIDNNSNRPLYVNNPIPLWLVESVYGVIEVKTQLTPSTLEDSIKKCVKFKKLNREYADDFGRQKIKDSLFCIWSFEGPNASKLQQNLINSLKNIDQQFQPDFIIIPGHILTRGGHYYDLSLNGQPGSAHYNKRLASVNGDKQKLLEPPFEMMKLGNNSITVFLYWINSWLYAAGPRRPDLIKYISETEWGTIVE